MKAKLLFLLFSISFVASGQKYIELYKDHLPEQILQSDRSTKETINAQIEERILLNPSMVYSFIEYLSRRYGQNILNNEENLLNLNTSLLVNEQKTKNRWIEREISNIRKVYPLAQSRGKVILFLNSGKVKERNVEKIDTTHQSDNNRKFYFTLIYLTNNQKLKYDLEYDYSRMVEECLIDSIKKVVDEIESFENSEGRDKKSIREKIFSLWYAFDKYASKIPIPYNKDAYDYLILLGEKVKKLSRDIDINLVLTTNFQNPLRIEETYTLPMIPNPISVSKDFNSLQFLVGVNMDVGIKETKTIFSRIRAEIAYHHSVKTKTEIITRPYSGETFNPNTFVTKNVNEFLLRSVSTLTAKVSTPIYFITNDFNIDAGIMVVYNMLKYDWKGVYAYEERNDVGDVYFHQQKTFANTIRSVVQYSLLPIVDLNISSLDPVMIRISGNPKFVGVTFQLNIYPVISEKISQLFSPDSKYN